MSKEIPKEGTPEWFKYQETLNIAFKSLRVTQAMEESVQGQGRPEYKDREARQRIVDFVSKRIDTK